MQLRSLAIPGALKLNREVGTLFKYVGGEPVGESYAPQRRSFEYCQLRWSRLNYGANVRQK